MQKEYFSRCFSPEKKKRKAEFRLTFRNEKHSYSHEFGCNRECGERVNNKYSSSVLGDSLQLRPQNYLDSLSFQRQKEGRNRFHLSTWWKQEGQGWCKEYMH